MDSPDATQVFLNYVRISDPIVLLIVFFIVFIAQSAYIAKDAGNSANNAGQYGPGGKPLPKRMRATMMLSRELPVELARKNSKALFLGLTLGVLVAYLAEAAVHMVHAITAKEQQWWPGQAVVIFVVGSFFAHTVVLISLLDMDPVPNVVQLVPWSLALFFDVVVLTTSVSIYTNPHRESAVGALFEGPLQQKMTFWETLEVAVGSARVLSLALLVLSYVIKIALPRRAAQKMVDGFSAEEAISLVNSEEGESPRDNEPESAEEPWIRPTRTPNTNWWEYLSGYSLFFPYVWPSKSRRLQIVAVFCFGLLVLQRVVNLIVPYQLGIITDSLSVTEGKLHVPWMQICLYVVYRWLQGGQGLIESIRSNMWISISQYAYMELSTAAFEHVHRLGLDFHLNKKMGEVLSALTKGNSINTFLEQVTFQVLPMFIDLGIAIGYFLVVFDAYYALAIAIMTFFYLYLTVKIASWRADMRRQMVNASRQEDAVKNDSLTSYETVKYFNAEQYEFTRYRGAVSNYLDSEYHSLFAQNLMNIVQNTIFMLGLLVTCFIATYQVAFGERPVGQFVTLLAYMTQLQAPLNIFGTFYRYIQSALINAERLLELFRVQPTIMDKPSAVPLALCQGHISFRDVGFSYDSRRSALNGLTFDCKPGTTTALVGESGGGKSTIFRLLYRFYNQTKGDIIIDGHNTQDVTIDSVRSHIGVVPQDTVLFNETLMYNLRYAHPHATDKDVYEACRAASIHDNIMSFPDGYETRVGDRGLRLSGGEKQRIAIARTVLKNPQIILLDEATAALDTETEQHIQHALSVLSQGRTVLIIAHRLSTITNADNIIVLHEGRVAESGTHNDLLTSDGRYAEMWRKQIHAQREAAITGCSCNRK